MPSPESPDQKNGSRSRWSRWRAARPMPPNKPKPAPVKNTPTVSHRRHEESLLDRDPPDPTLRNGLGREGKPGAPERVAEQPAERPERQQEQPRAADASAEPDDPLAKSDSPPAKPGALEGDDDEYEEPSDEATEGSGSDAIQDPSADPPHELDEDEKPSSAYTLDDPPPHDSPDQETDSDLGHKAPTRTSEVGGANTNDGGQAAEDSNQDSLKIDDQTRPLTDKEWAEHLTEVRNKLGESPR